MPNKSNNDENADTVIEILSPVQEDKTSKADPMNLWGLWDGDETIEELLEELD